MLRLENIAHTCATRLPSRHLIVTAAALMMGFGLGQLAIARSDGISLQTLLETSTSVVGEPIVYETSQPALITARELVLAPGAELPWHRHPMPTFGYVIEGEIVVDYGPKGSRTFRKGDTLMEAMSVAHRGRNTSAKPVRVLAVSIGSRGQPLSRPASEPAQTVP